MAARDGMMETLSARYDIFNPAPSAGAAGSDTPGVCPALPYPASCVLIDCF